MTVDGTLVVTCEFRAALSNGGSSRMAGTMIIPAVNRLRSAEGALEQWLALYRDRQLRRVGRGLVREWQRSTSHALALEESN